jgi:hypothetical protein
MKSVRHAAAPDAGDLLETDPLRFEAVYPPGSDTPEIRVRIYALLRWTLTTSRRRAA